MTLGARRHGSSWNCVLASWALLGLLAVGSEAAGKKKPTETAATNAPTAKWQEKVGEVNGDVITREQLADELISAYGAKQLDLMMNRKLIEQSCKQAKVTITRVDIEAEINETLKKLNVSRKEFVERVLKRQDITYAQYVQNTIMPALALKRLVQGNVQVTEEDLKKAYEANYGEKVDVRMLVVREIRRAHELWEKTMEVQEPQKRLELFEELCKTYSIDAATRPYGGRTQPINKFSGYPEIEEMAFNLKEGELSKIVQVPDGNLILLCVKRIPANPSVQMDSIFNNDTKQTVREVLKQDIQEKKTRLEVATLFQKVRDEAKFNNYLSNDFPSEDIQAEEMADTPRVDPAVRPVGHVEPAEATTTVPPVKPSEKKPAAAAPATGAGSSAAPAKKPEPAAKK